MKSSTPSETVSSGPPCGVWTRRGSWGTGHPVSGCVGALSCVRRRGHLGSGCILVLVPRRGFWDVEVGWGEPLSPPEMPELYLLQCWGLAGPLFSHPNWVCQWDRDPGDPDGAGEGSAWWMPTGAGDQSAAGGGRHTVGSGLRWPQFPLEGSGSQTAVPSSGKRPGTAVLPARS